VGHDGRDLREASRGCLRITYGAAEVSAERKFPTDGEILTTERFPGKQGERGDRSAGYPLSSRSRYSGATEPPA
jgi:hypothetical protein